jgi:cytochrome c-type biogenesis protein CcmH/NrfG
VLHDAEKVLTHAVEIDQRNVDALSLFAQAEAALGMADRKEQSWTSFRKIQIQSDLRGSNAPGIDQFMNALRAKVLSLSPG